MISPLLLAVTLLLVVVGAIPTRRLGAAGFRAGGLATYLAVVVGLGLVLYLGVLPARFVAPVLVVVFVVPLVVPPDLFGRLLRRSPLPGGRAASNAGAGGARPVGSGPGRTVRPDGTVEPDPPPDQRA